MKFEHKLIRNPNLGKNKSDLKKKIDKLQFSLHN